MILQPNAKINLGLNVVARRADGYHNLETVFYPLQLADSLTVTLQNENADIVFQQEGIAVDCPAEDNLIVRAFRLLQPLCKGQGVRIHFSKHIPFGAGLGGGSSDAAHTLLAINELIQLNLTQKQLCEYAAKLGADCPFFILNTPCLATGIGDILTPILLSLQGYKLVLIKPDIHVSTKAAYAGIIPQQPTTPLAELIRQPIHTWKDRVINDFEHSVFAQFPAIGAIKDQLYNLGAIYASMSGSGSSVFGIFSTTTCPTKEHLQTLFPNTFVHTETCR